LPPQPPALVSGLKQSAKKVVIAVLNLLVVDDDSVDLMTVKRGLLKAGIAHRIAEAKDGVEALAILRMNGLEFLSVLRADPKLASTPVVIISTSSQEQDRREAHRLHVAGYFVKSLDFSSFVELLAIIDRYWSAVQYP
jgi:CheY-like chemotaxis protein